MNILILNGSPRPKGSTRQMIDTFREGAVSAGHTVEIADVCKMKIGGCLAFLFRRISCATVQSEKGRNDFKFRRPGYV